MLTFCFSAKRRLFAAGILLFVALVACDRDRPVAVQLEKRQPLPEQDAPPWERDLKICVGSMITPEEGYGYYRRLLDYIGEKMGMRVQALDPGNYEEVNNLLKSNKVDVAFVCGGPYVKGREEFGLQLIAAPVVNGEAAYYSYLIVPVGSPATSIADLRGKSFAFTDPDSNTGRLVPTDQLARLGETPDTFFSSYLFTYGHDRSIRAVSDRLVDGAAVDSLIWDFLAATHPEMTSRTRVITRTGPYGMPPVVASPGLDKVTREKLQDVLLNAHHDPQGRLILHGMQIEKFIQIEDSAYDSIRQLASRPKPPPAEAARP